ncbi:TPA: hypothetical protein ACM383_005225, partial [Escherichia coli]|nr:hypothetical protein [Klebsiella pneumoniae]HCK5541302.1 hypothetical protein [Salmonella enterica subsp. enterica serovar Typhimurium var. monophasic 4,[5],12:i:-]HCK7072616.1 hypothetical protein [Klebsiella pneumoniae]HCK7089592.1 hypothetical protein [Klebsiella pneumoniae]HCW2949499.1 hypothetical protein [Escherichia coli]
GLAPVVFRSISHFKRLFSQMPPAISSRVLNVFGVDYKSHLPEEYAAYLAANQPVMTCVYGNTATGKTNFKDSLLRCISDDMAENFLVEDEDNGRISEDTRLHLFKSFFDEGRNVVFVEHAHNCSCMITRFVNAMASSKVNFIFIGEVGPARKAKMITAVGKGGYTWETSV